MEATDPKTLRASMHLPSPGDVLAGKYLVERVLGKGGMGLVLAARHNNLRQPVAIKVLLPEAVGAEALARFTREARAAAGIQSEHVAQVRDFGTLEDGAPYLVMEYLDGTDLKRLIEERGALPSEDAVDYVLQACEALCEAHLLVSTQPPGARVFADGLELREHSPTTVLLLPGHHRIEIDLAGWTDAREYDAAGGGASDSMKFTRPAKPKPETPKPETPKPAPPKPPKAAPPKPETPTKPVLEGLMGEGALSIYGYRFVGTAKETQGSSTTTANSQPGGVAFGLSIEVGWALSHRTALLLRGFGGLGSSSGNLASLGAGGPAVTFRLNDSWWTGGGVLFGAGRANSGATSNSSIASASDTQITVRTDLAVGPMLELSYALADNPAGQWLVSIMPSTLFTTLGKQSTIFLPLVIGHRWL